VTLRGIGFRNFVSGALVGRRLDQLSVTNLGMSLRSSLGPTCADLTFQYLDGYATGTWESQYFVEIWHERDRKQTCWVLLIPQSEHDSRVVEARFPKIVKAPPDDLRRRLTWFESLVESDEELRQAVASGVASAW
jgi:hypothetical protein